MPTSFVGMDMDVRLQGYWNEYDKAKNIALTYNKINLILYQLKLKGTINKLCMRILSFLGLKISLI